MPSSLADLKYPVGLFLTPAAVSREQRLEWMAILSDLPIQLRRATCGLTDEQIDTPYRPDGWTVRQVVHHLADSHMNANIRIRLALTEDSPLIKPYFEDRWAELPDARSEDVEVSLRLLEALHRRWHRLWESLTDEQFARTYRHPEMGEMRMDQVLALYAWHSAHHLAHVTNLKSRSHW